MLLLSDGNRAEGRLTSAEMSQLLGMHINTVDRIRKRLVLEGEQPALDRKPRATPPILPKIDGHAEVARRLEIHRTPRNGSWLNVAEIELCVLSRQCLDRRIVTRAELTRATEAWEVERNADGSKVSWRFTTEDARIRLMHLYPQI